MKSLRFDGRSSQAITNQSNNVLTGRYSRAIRFALFMLLTLSSVHVMLSQTITTGTVVGPFCAGSTLNVPYSYSGGTPAAGNVFTAELSNASGSFASPTVIGTFTSQLANWTVPAVIPATIVEGTGYRIRVRSSSPAVIGTPNNTNITLYEIYTGSTIFLETHGTGTGSVATYEAANNFDNDALTMSSTGSVTVVTTNISNGYTGASGASSIHFTNNGTYTIAGVNTLAFNQMGLGFGVMKNSAASNGSELSVDVSSDGTTWTPLTFAPLPTGGGTNNTWYYRVTTGNIPSTANLRIRFTRSGGNNIQIDDIELANAVSTATVDLTPPGPVQICSSGGSVLLTATSVPNAIYSWTGPGGGTNNTKNATSAGSYSVSASDLFGCSVNRGPVVVTTASSIAPLVSISSNLGSSICAGTSVTFTASPTYGGSNPSYQWRINGSNVGTNSPTFTTSSLTNGQVVSVVMTSNLSCASPTTATSNNITMTVTPQPTWFLDADNDNYYVGSGITQCDSPGAGYKTTGLIGGNDCNDANANVWQSGSLYIDVDGDGRTNGTQVVCYGASVPAGFSATTLGADCDDNNASVWQTGNLFVDADGDGYTVGAAQSICYGASIPAGYVAVSSGTDCNDANANVWQSGSLYIDVDGDGRTNGTQVVCYGASVPSGYSASTLGADCDDNNASVWQTGNLFVDADGDGYTVGAAQPVCYGASIPSGYVAVSAGSDCNDANANVWQSGSLFIDADGDGRDNGTQIVCYGASIPNGFMATTLGSDCNDGNASVWQNALLFVDQDGDGYTNGTQTVCYGNTIPAGFALTSLGNDCNDNNASVNPAASESCGNGIDDNCNGQIDENCALAPINDAPQGAIQVANSGNSFPNCGIINGNHANATNSPESIIYNGNDVWYRFTAQSSGVVITQNGNATQNVVMLFDNNLNPVPGTFFAVSNGVGGPAILLSTNLTAGQQYYISVGTVSGGGPFSLCVRHLLASFCVDGSTTYSLCSNLKPQWTGASSYTYDFTPTGATPGSPFSHTVASQLPLSTPALGLIYGGTYDVSISANYTSLTNGNNQSFGTVSIPGVITSSITIAPHNLIRTKESQVHPATVLRGTILASKPFVCTAVNYTVEFTKVSNQTGNVEIGLPFTVNTANGVSTLSLSFNQPQQISGQSFYKVRWRPNFSYGAGSYGEYDVIFVGGAAMEEQPAFEAANLFSTKTTYANVTLGIYPNPNTGNQFVLNVTDITSPTISVRVLDLMGKVYYSKQLTVSGSVRSIVQMDADLSGGVYFVEIVDGNKTITEKMIVQK